MLPKPVECSHFFWGTRHGEREASPGVTSAVAESFDGAQTRTPDNVCSASDAVVDSGGTTKPVGLEHTRTHANSKIKNPIFFSGSNDATGRINLAAAGEHARLLGTPPLLSRPKRDKLVEKQACRSSQREMGSKAS